MYLTAISPTELKKVLGRFTEGLAALPSGDEAASALRAWARIAETHRWIGGTDDSWHADAVGLCQAFEMKPLAELPAEAFSWDGEQVRSLSEPSVLIHEVAHFQLASPRRRRLPDFGLGAGPETGFAAEADAARILDDPAREAEEQMASLLGILWEAEFRQPALSAFHEQNWLEGAGRASTAAFFAATLGKLIAAGLVDQDGRPRMAMRVSVDDPFDCLTAARPMDRAA